MIEANKRFENAKSKYLTEEDQATIAENKRVFDTASQLLMFSESEAGKILITQLKSDISKAIQLLIETRKARYVSDLESNLNLLNKLIGSKSTADAISSWLDSIE